MARLSIKGEGWQDNRRSQQGGSRRRREIHSSDSEEESSSENASGVDETDSDSEQSDQTSTGPSKQREEEDSTDEPSDEESDEESIEGTIETPKQRRAGSQARLRNVGQKPFAVKTTKRPRQTSDGSSQNSDRDSEEHENGKSVKRPAGRPAGGRSLTTRRWRPYAKQERDLICRRGGLIWQAARPLLEEMSAKDRSAAATALREMTRSLDARMQLALVPSTDKLPGRSNGLAALNEKDYRPTLSSLMSWVLSTGGTLPSYDDDDDDDDDGGGGAADLSRASNFASTSSEQSKGFEADKRVLEELLMPEINGLISLQRASEAQDRELELAKRELDRLQQATDVIEGKSEAVREDLSALLRDAMASTQDRHTSNSLDKMLRASSAATL